MFENHGSFCEAKIRWSNDWLAVRKGEEIYALERDGYSERATPNQCIQPSQACRVSVSRVPPSGTACFTASDKIKIK